MHSLYRFATAALVALILATLALPNANAAPIKIDWVTVGDPGNENDPATGNLYGGVAEAYRIMKFEFTNSQYAEFLNAIDPDGTNPNSVYSRNMGSESRGGISFTKGNSAGTKYAVRSNMGDKPVNFVSWFDAARVANWLHNGAQTYGSTDSSASAPQNTGAYSVGTALSAPGAPVNAGALFYVPTENEWYKAAYYNPTLNSGTGGYHVYGNGFDSTPGIVSADTFGNGSAGGTGNFANYSEGASWNSLTGNVTTVGTNGGSSYYGAFDMSGNLFEWNNLTGDAGFSRGIRGGDWGSDAGYLSSSHRFSGLSASPVGESIVVGFRLASWVPTTSILFKIASGTQTQGAAGFSLLTPVNATSVTKTGDGTVVFDAANTYTGPTSIQQGSIRVAHAAALSTSTIIPLAGGTLSLAANLQTTIGGLSPNAGGLVDVGTGLVTVASELSASDLVVALLSGRAGGSWSDSSGIASSAAAASGGSRTVGWIENGDGSVTFGYAAAGDTNLDWTIDIIDIANFLGSGKFNSGLTATWAEGDFNYDGFADITDIADFMSSGLFNAGPYNTPAGTIAAVPEPSTYAMALVGLACGAYSMFRRRKRA